MILWPDTVVEVCLLGASIKAAQVDASKCLYTATPAPSISI